MQIEDRVMDSQEKIGFLLRTLYAGTGYSRYRMGKFEEYDLYSRNKNFLFSENVITGLIQANILSKIAFSVSSDTDSRTILGVAGAEKLQGMGDMLYWPTGFYKPMRVQGAFVSDKEVKSVTDYIRKKYMDSE